MKTEYQKINTLFKRDENKVIIPSEITLQEFEYLKDLKWECTEKIDGTNIRITLSPKPYNECGSDFTIQYQGRTDKANIPKHLLNKLYEIIPVENLISIFHSEERPLSVPVTIYGEGYGVKIQKGGNYISNDVSFIMFDVKVGDMWLSRESCESISQRLNIDIVPLVGYFTISEAIEFVRSGFKSTIAENKDYDAEGLVAKTPCGLLDRSGNRIITKIKTVDFVKYDRQRSK